MVGNFKHVYSNVRTMRCSSSSPQSRSLYVRPMPVKLQAQAVATSMASDASQCTRCGYVLKCTETATRGEVLRLAAQHMHSCPALSAPMDTRLRSNGPSTSTQEVKRSGPIRRSTPAKSPKIAAAAQKTRKRNKHVMDENQRRQALEDDEWSTDVEETSLNCRGCGRRIKLDKRSKFYPGLWIKHRSKCHAIRRWEEKARKGEIGQPKRMAQRPKAGAPKSAELPFEEDVTMTEDVEKTVSPLPQNATSAWALKTDRFPSCAEQHASLDSSCAFRQYSIEPPPVVADAAPHVSDTRFDERRGLSAGHNYYHVGSDYWTSSPFSDGDPEKAGRYRYSNRLDLATNYGEHCLPCAESVETEILQAAQFLAGLKTGGRV